MMSEAQILGTLAHTMVASRGTWLVPCPRPLILGPAPLEGLTQQLFRFRVELSVG
jgi:hypothetical protein